MASPTSRHGLTLVEMAATLAVIAVAATAAAPGLRGLLDSRRLDGVATTLAADLQLARNEAIARNAPVRVTLHATQQCYVVHTGAASQCDCTGAEGPALCSGGATQIRTARWNASDALTLRSNTASLLFDPLHGTASPTATWRVVAADGRAVHHVVNVMGRVRTCAGAGAIPGLRPC